MNKKISVFIFILLMLFSDRCCLAREIAIVINKANPLEELSLKDLIEIFKQDRQYWDGEKINLLMREDGAWEKEIILKKVYAMSDEELRKFCLGKVFRGEIATFPQIISSQTLIKKLVCNLSGAIGFLDAQVIDDSVKVIKIEGRLPGEEGYLLKEGKE